MKNFLLNWTGLLLYEQLFPPPIFSEIPFLAIILGCLWICETKPFVHKLILGISLWCIFLTLTKDWYDFKSVPFQFLWNLLHLTEDAVRADYLYCYFYLFYYGTVAWYSFDSLTKQKQLIK